MTKRKRRDLSIDSPVAEWVAAAESAGAAFEPDCALNLWTQEHLDEPLAAVRQAPAAVRQQCVAVVLERLSGRVQSLQPFLDLARGVAVESGREGEAFLRWAERAVRHG